MFRTTLAGMLLASLWACEREPILVVSGVVSSSAFATPIESATVRLYFVPPFWDQSPRTIAAYATTDAAGRYTLQAGAQPGYAAPNCSLIQLAFSAKGFVPQDYVPLDRANDTDQGCRTRTIDVALDSI